MLSFLALLACRARVRVNLKAGSEEGRGRRGERTMEESRAVSDISKREQSPVEERSRFDS